MKSCANVGIQSATIAGYRIDPSAQCDHLLENVSKVNEGLGQVTGVRVYPQGGEERSLPVDGAFVYFQGG